jgi:sulfur carrier protein
MQTPVSPSATDQPQPATEITLNGEPAAVPAGLTVAALLEHLRVDGSRVAVEVNRQIVKRSERANVMVEPGAVVEVVHFVGGGRS